MNSILIITIIINHLCYQAILKKLNTWGISIDSKSWGMGFSKNIPAYFHYLRSRGTYFDGLMCSLLVSTLVGVACVLGWWYQVFYINMVR